VQVWEASDHLCSKRLVSFLPDLLAVLEHHKEVHLEPAVREQLLTLSAATIDRLLQAVRPRPRRRPYTQGTAASSLKAQIPIRTFTDWADTAPGAVQADLVAHCGDSTEGFYLTTLNVVDVATGWTECVSVWGKGQQRVGTAVHQVRQSLPFALRELHTDNGSEFLNAVVYPWCRNEGIRLTRGRPYKKNDQAHVEQRNWSVIRRLVGYDRYATKAALSAFEQLYRLLRLYVNYFQPLRKLVSKERVGSKVMKRYDAAQTPYRRVLRTGILTVDQAQRLDQEYHRLNPVRLRLQIDEALAVLWPLAETSDPLAVPTIATLASNGDTTELSTTVRKLPNRDHRPD
jgi:transposase InsO family protein